MFPFFVSMPRFWYCCVQGMVMVCFSKGRRFIGGFIAIELRELLLPVTRSWVICVGVWPMF